MGRARKRRGEEEKGKRRGSKGRKSREWAGPRPSKYFGLEPSLIPQSSPLEYSKHIYQLVIARRRHHEALIDISLSVVSKHYCSA